MRSCAHTRPVRASTLCLLMLVVAACAAGCLSNRPASPPQSVEVTFSPKPADGKNGACWGALAPFINGDIAATGHLGIGDWFPVAEPEAPELFQVHLVAGSDASVTVEARAGEVTRRMVIEKDGYTVCDIAGVRYEVAYPRCHVGISSLPSSGTTGVNELDPEGHVSKIMLMVRRIDRQKNHSLEQPPDRDK